MTAAVLTAADGDLPDIPGQPYVSPDDLASIGPMWSQAVQQQLVPVVAEVYQTSAGVVHAQMVDATQVPTLPSVGSLAAEQYLAAATNTFEQVGDDLWATARSELLDGFEKGESIDQLAARLRASAGMTAKKAVLVARTQVLDASNAGSIATARAAGIDMQKEWMSAEDLRVRPEHVLANGQKVDLNAKFTVGGYECDRPHDPTLPPALRYSCRCTTGYLIPDDSVDDAVREAEPVPPIPGTSGVVEPLPDPYAGDLVAPALPGPGVGVPGEVAPLPGLAVRPMLEAARTTSAVQSVFAAETRRITGRFIPIRFTGSAATAREHAEGLLRGLERFPDARLGGVDAMEARGAAYAATSYNEILFSELWTTPAARRRYLGSVASDVQDGWHVANSGNPVAIALHEFGHLLDFTTDINRGVRERIREIVARRAAAEGVGQDVLIRREVSGYATSHTDELVAEAFTDVMINGEAASGLSREIFTLLEDAYRQAGGTVQAVTREALTVPRVAKARAGSTIGDVELGPTQFQVAIGEADLPRRPVGDFTDRPYDGPDGVVVHRGEPLPAGFESPLAAIRRGEYTLRPGLTDAESQALDRYVLSRVADPLNTALRQGTAPPFGTVKVVDQVVDLDDVAAQLDSAIAASELSADTTLYRGALMRPADLRKLQPGAITREDAFLSTTTESENAFEIIHWRKGRDPAGGKSPVIFEILAPRGTAGAVADVGEREVLLGRGRRFRVVEVRRPTTPGGTRRIVLEILPDTPAPLPAPVVTPLASRTVPQLRALAKERGITIPPGFDITGVRTGEDALDATRSVQTLVQAAQLGRLPDVPRLRFGDQRRLIDAVYDRETGYAGRGYRAANRGLQVARGGDLPDDIRDQVANLDQVISLGTLSDDVVLYRGVARPELLTGGRALQLGDEFTEYGYGSTSVSVDHAVDFARGRSTPLDEAIGRPENPTVVRLVAPRGQSAVQVSDLEFPGVGEVLLPRGMSYRVVADRGVVDGVRHVDVEIIPTPVVPVAAPAVEVPLAKRTVAQLRALAAERKITVPKGAKKPDIVRLLEAPPLTEAEQRAAVRALARETNTLIEQTSATARALAEVDELLAKKAAASTIREAIADALVEPGQLFAGADSAVLAALRAVASDPVKLRAAVTRLGGKAKIKPVSKAGAKVTFDADTMEGVGGIDIPDGTRVTVVRRGSTVTLPDGTVMQLEKARVTPVVAPVKKAAPAKKAPAKKAPAAKLGPASVRQPGVDLTPEVTPDAAWLQQAGLRRSFGDPTDKVLTSIVRQQPGWSDPGRVVSQAELDRAVRSGWVEMWRGVQDYPAGATAADIARATRVGDWDMGTGMFGNGIYTTVRRTTAEVYRSSDFVDWKPTRMSSWGPEPLYEWLPGFTPTPQGAGGLLRMALDPNARIIDYEDLRREHRAFVQSIDFTGLQDTAYKRAWHDQNFYAVMRGYDGVRVYGPGTNDGSAYPAGVRNSDEPPQFIIFNRSVLIFERASRRYDS